MSGRFSLLWERVLTFRENLAGADGLDLKSPSKPVVTPGPGTTGRASGEPPACSEEVAEGEKEA